MDNCRTTCLVFGKVVGMALSALCDFNCRLNINVILSISVGIRRLFHVTMWRNLFISVTDNFLL